MVLLMLGFLALGAVMTAALTAMVRVGRVKALHLEQEKKKGSQPLLRIVEDPGHYLSTVLLLAVASQVAATVTGTHLIVGRVEGAAALLSVVVMTVLVLVFAQLVPRTFSMQRSERTALRLARLVWLLGRLLRPLTRVLIALANVMFVFLPGRGMAKGPFVAEEDMRGKYDVDEEEEEIEEEERELIHSIFEFGDTLVREVMVPRPDMVVLKGSTTFDEALTVIIEAGYSRIPLYENDTDNITGLLYAKDLMKALHEGERSRTIEQLARNPTFIPETKKVAELLREMQNQHVHMAIVVDEYGGTAGLVTIEDLIEEIVGEIVDEYDKEEPLVEPLDGGRMRFDAKMPIDEVNDLFGVELPDEEWDTVGGLVFGLTGRVPVPGESVHFDGLVFTTERVSGRRIKKVVVGRKASDEGPDGG